MAEPKSPKASAAESPSFYGAADLDYQDYLRIQTLLDLQVPQSDPEHHDEMLFIIIHQAYELWFKLLLHEVERAIRLLDEDRPAEARHFLVRVVAILRLLTQQIHLLVTMRPVDFLAFRDKLKPASGFQSLQFREIEFLLGLKEPRYLKWFEVRPEQHAKLKARLAGPDLRARFYAALARAGYKIPRDVDPAQLDQEGPHREAAIQAMLPMYTRPDEHRPWATLVETLVDLDEAFALWRQDHVVVVERIIGNKQGTGGSSGAAYLRATTTKRFFPLLWELRTYLEASP